MLATWRISSLFVFEDGPFNLTAKIRKWAGIDEGVEVDEDGNEILLAPFFEGVLSCLKCFSVWPGILATIFLSTYIVTTYGAIVLLFMPFAISAGAIIIDKILESLD